MSEDYNGIINELKDNINEIITLYKKEKEVNKTITKEIILIREQLNSYKEKYEIAERKYENLKLAKSLTDEGSSQESKNKLNKIIREIDNCIALINK